MSTKEKIQEQGDVLTLEKPLNEIMLHNDDVNTFDHVIDSLIDVCEHSLQQAEQCTVLVHYKGKCVVKTGEYEHLVPKCSRLLELGLSVEII